VTAELLRRCDRVELVVRDPGAHGLSAAEVGAALGLSVVATLRSESAVAQAALRGDPPLRRGRGSLVDRARSLVAATAAGLAA
jgi:hypothetical protein